MNPQSKTRAFKIVCGIVASLAIVILLSGLVCGYKIAMVVYKIDMSFRQITKSAVEALGYGAIDVSFPNEEGVYVPGWYRAGENRAAIVFLHGLGGNRMQLAGIAARFIDEGYSVLLIDQRGHGEHPERLTTFGRAESLDAVAAVEWLRGRNEVDPDRIGVYGASMGASTCIYAAAQDTQSEIACAVADSSFADLRTQAYHDLARHEFPISVPLWLRPVTVTLFFIASKYAIGKWAAYPDPMDVVGEIKCPLFLIHGDGDERIDPESFVKLSDAARAAGVDLTAWLVPNENHCTYHDSPEFLQRLSQFFGEHLLDRPPF